MSFFRWLHKSVSRYDRHDLPANQKRTIGGVVAPGRCWRRSRIAPCWPRRHVSRAPGADALWTTPDQLGRQRRPAGRRQPRGPAPVPCRLSRRACSPAADVFLQPCRDLDRPERLAVEGLLHDCGVPGIAPRFSWARHGPRDRDGIPGRSGWSARQTSHARASAAGQPSRLTRRGQPVGRLLPTNSAFVIPIEEGVKEGLRQKRFRLGTIFHARGSHPNAYLGEMCNSGDFPVAIRFRR